MSKKEDIINTALELFNQIGYNATGVGLCCTKI